jgi:hypothetical protein
VTEPFPEESTPTTVESQPSKFKPKETVERKAMFYDGSLLSAACIAAWVIQSGGGVRTDQGNNIIEVCGIEQWYGVSPGFYVVQEVTADTYFYTARQDEFEASWEK